MADLDFIWLLGRVGILAINLLGWRYAVMGGLFTVMMISFGLVMLEEE